jgi:anti-sigma factor RsiW
MTSPDPDCRHLLGELSAYLDGEATTEVCAEIERHLADCDDCRVVIDTLRKTVSLYHTLPPPSLSAGAREKLFRTLRLEDFLTPKS